MIVVDTSVWVSALRSASGYVTPTLNQLLDADEVALALPVRMELLTGASKRDRLALRRGLSALPVLYPTDATWQTIDEWIERAGHAGQSFGFGDLLIGALGSEIGALIWSLDQDFARMGRLGLVQLYEP